MGGGTESHNDGCWWLESGQERRRENEMVKVEEEGEWGYGKCKDCIGFIGAAKRF